MIASELVKPKSSGRCRVSSVSSRSPGHLGTYFSRRRITLFYPESAGPEARDTSEAHRQLQRSLGLHRGEGVGGGPAASIDILPFERFFVA